MTEDINLLWTAIIHGVAESASYHTVGLAHIDQDKQEIGTGTAVAFRGRNFIVTAGHVIEGWPDEIHVLVRGQTPIRVHGDAIQPGHRLMGIEPAVKVRIAERYEGEELDDLAAIVLRPSSHLALLRFYELPESASSPPVGTKIMVHGYPEEGIRRMRNLRGQRAMVSQALVQLSIVLDPSPYGMLNYDPEHHYLLQFKRSSGAEVVTHPRGLSGAGAWIAPPWKEGAVWDPTTIRLAGIQVRWYRGHLVQKVTRVERVIALLNHITRTS